MKDNKQLKAIPFFAAILPLLFMISSMALVVIVFEGGVHVPLIIGAVVGGLIAWKYGYDWMTIEKGIYDAIRLALPAILIIMTVGLIISSWIGGGIIATMIYYGLKLVSPSLFLVSICILCCVVSLSIGSSWSTMGTIGVAGMGIGLSMGISAPIVAGAIISGAYFGDKMSPLSDTTNLASGITETDLFEHIKHMIYTTFPGLIIALIVYYILGRNIGQHDMNGTNIDEILTVMDQAFVISPWLLLVPVIIILMVAKKVPALPALLTGAFLGWFCQVFVQGDQVSNAIIALTDGYSIETGNKLVDELFNRGGIEDMMYTVSLTIVAMSFAGIMESTGMLEVILNKIMKVAKSAKSLIPITEFSSFFTNVVCAEQYISILLPGRMFPAAFKKYHLKSKNLSRALEDAGTLTSPLVPWNTCGVFIASTLMVNPFDYIPYAVLNYTVPIIGIIFAIIGYKVEYVDPHSVQNTVLTSDQSITRSKELH
ncbi:Na+/H+ antiporter NhaC [Caldifermentibacillus hisashii]|uniref:Na+/H+ antiporter NhaC n=1 Tax=Caldifermentibacillus hisashii TaxID=996558 RepID=UPI0030EA1C02